MNAKEVRACLLTAVAEAGSQRAFGEAHGMSAEYVRLVVVGKRPLGDRILAALGIEKRTVTTYKYKGKR